MELHGNAALSWSGRRVLAVVVVEQGWTLTAAAEAAGVSVRCARKWVGRYRAEGERGLLDRSSAPRRVANRTAEERVEVIVAAAAAADDGGRDRRDAARCRSRPSPGSCAGSGWAGSAGSGSSSRSATSARGRASSSTSTSRSSAGSRAAPASASRRPRQHYNAADAPTPPACAATRSAGSTSTSPSTTTADSPTPKCSPTRKPQPRPRFLRRAIAFYRRHGITVERVLTDNGSAYRVAVHAVACRALGIRHLRTRPYRPQTNGKAERFIRTLLNGWAYGAIYRSSHERTARP